MNMKYFARKIKIDGHTFDSKTEAGRYQTLRTRERQGTIQHLEMQKEFELLPRQIKLVKVQLKTKSKLVERVDEKAVRYHCDFYYFDTLTQKFVIEEVKSRMTAQIRDYPLRRKLVKLMVKRLNEEAGSELYQFREIIA